LTGTYKASAIAAAGNAESRSPTRDFSLARSRSRRISHTHTTHRAMFGHTHIHLCASARVLVQWWSSGDGRWGFSELLPSLAARRLLTMVCAWWWGRGRLMTVGNSTVGYDGRNFDGWRFLAGAQCRIFWRIFLVPNILENILAGT